MVTTLESLLFKNFYKNIIRLEWLDKHLIMKQTVSALNYMHNHELKFLHRDIKPANIIIDVNKKVNLCDLGLVKIRQCIDSQFHSVDGEPKPIGTFTHMAPELLLKEAAPTEHSDVWSLGCTLIELYQEDYIFPIEENVYGEMVVIFRNKVQPRMNKVPKILLEILNQCVQYEPCNRITTTKILSNLEHQGIA